MFWVLYWPRRLHYALIVSLGVVVSGGATAGTSSVMWTGWDAIHIPSNTPAAKISKPPTISLSRPMLCGPNLSLAIHKA